MCVDLWHEMESPLQRIWFLEVQGVQGVLGGLMGLSSLVDQKALVALRTLLYPQIHIHPAKRNKNLLFSKSCLSNMDLFYLANRNVFNFVIKQR